jgi:hypothetical protein
MKIDCVCGYKNASHVTLLAMSPGTNLTFRENPLMVNWNWDLLFQGLILPMVTTIP